eukprot:scaffold2853_cov246-Pinguiococcus_pyrenoidosus.AAC.1
MESRKCSVGRSTEAVKTTASTLLSQLAALPKKLPWVPPTLRVDPFEGEKPGRDTRSTSDLRRKPDTSTLISRLVVSPAIRSFAMQLAYLTPGKRICWRVSVYVAAPQGENLATVSVTESCWIANARLFVSSDRSAWASMVTVTSRLPPSSREIKKICLEVLHCAVYSVGRSVVSRRSRPWSATGSTSSRTSPASSADAKLASRVIALCSPEAEACAASMLILLNSKSKTELTKVMEKGRIGCAAILPTRTFPWISAFLGIKPTLASIVSVMTGEMTVVTAVNLRVELDASQEAVKSRMKPAWEISPLQQM